MGFVQLLKSKSRWDLTSEVNLSFFFLPTIALTIAVPISRNPQSKIVGKRPPPGSTMDPLATVRESSFLKRGRVPLKFFFKALFSFFWKPSVLRCPYNQHKESAPGVQVQLTCSQAPRQIVKRSFTEWAHAERRRTGALAGLTIAYYFCLGQQAAHSVRGPRLVCITPRHGDLLTHSFCFARSNSTPPLLSMPI